jgi:hypothetical protein
MRDSKECVECGGIYFRPENGTQGQWEARKYCSPACAGKAQARRLHERAKEALAAAAEFVPEPAEVVTQTLLPVEKAPIVRDLRIVRVGPNPRTVTCEYLELAQRRTCTVFVKRNDKYVRGMRFKMAGPIAELEFERPWVYTGAAPRRRGRW